MDKNIKVSIILPTLNGGKYISNAIESVLNQAFKNWELIVWDDGSSDNVRDIIESYILKNNNISYFRNEVNLDIQKTLNLAMRKCTGKYIARIDDDDEWSDERKLEKQVFFMENNKDHVLIGVSDIIIVNQDRQRLYNYKLPKNDSDIRKRILSKNCFVHTGVMFRKDAALDFGGYDETINSKRIEDYDLWLKLGLVGKFANIDSRINFMARKGSLTSDAREMQARNILKILPKYKNKYPNIYYGYIISLLRLMFFKTISNMPINTKIIYKIQSLYKNI